MSDKAGKKKNPSRDEIRTKIIQNMLATDPEINRVFDQMAANDLATKKKASRIHNRPRRHGRPKGGKIVFDQYRIDALPPIGCLSDVARILGVKPASVQQWCALRDDPLPCVKAENRTVMRKDMVIAWLIRTERYKPKENHESTAAAGRG